MKVKMENCQVVCGSVALDHRVHVETTIGFPWIELMRCARKKQYELTLFHGAPLVQITLVCAVASANRLSAVWVRTKPFPWCALALVNVKFIVGPMDP